jgi:predicted acetyltransferase
VTIEVRSCAPDELRSLVSAVETAFGGELRDEALRDFETIVERDRLLCATDDEAVVGGAGAYSFRLTIPGGEIAAAGVSDVGVMPTHRRRGVLTSMMRRQLDDVRERGEAVAILWASEGSIYGRFGYGLASLGAAVEAQARSVTFRGPAEPVGRVRLIDEAEATTLLPPLYDALRSTLPGMISRTPAWWASEVIADQPYRRHGQGRKFVAVHEVEGKADGYAIYRISQDWQPAGANHTVGVREVIAADARTEIELWRYVFSIDLVGTVSARLLPADHPLLLAVTEPRRLQFRLSDGLWVRLVDVAAALGARRYRGSGSVVLEIDDAFCPWNSGRWRLAVTDGAGELQR